MADIKRVILTVDRSQLFEMIRAGRGDASGLGQRLIEVLLGSAAGAQISLLDAMGLGVYGIVHEATENRP